MSQKSSKKQAKGSSKAGGTGRARPTSGAGKPRATIGTVAVWCAYDEIANLDEIRQNPRNPNKHPQEQIERLARIIRGTGWREPITVSTRSGYIVKGHGRFLAALQAGLTQAPVVRQYYATEALEHADLIADNRIAELSEIDEALAMQLAGEIRRSDEAFDIGLTGYELDELDQTAILDDNGAGDSAKAGGERPEVEFTEELLLEHNYIVLYFDNPFDWLVAVDKFGLKQVKDLIPRKAQPIGLGRVLRGADWLRRIK